MAKVPYTLHHLNQILHECGCCQHPSCCEPEVEYQSGSCLVDDVGFVDHDESNGESGSDDEPWKVTKYLRRVLTSGYTGYAGVQVPYPSPNPEGEKYIGSSAEGSITMKYFEEYSSPIEASASGIYTCKEDDSVFSTRCTYAGSMTEEHKGTYRHDGKWHSYVSTVVSMTVSSVAGQRRKEHIEWEENHSAWEAANPNYEQDVQQYNEAHSAWQAAEAQWQNAWNNWHAGGQQGEEPPYPNAPTEPPKPPSEPTKFYSECTSKSTYTRRNYRIVYQDGLPVREMVPSSPGNPNPYNYETIPMQAIGVAVPTKTTYEEPVSWRQWLSLADAWVNANVISFPNDSADESAAPDLGNCKPGDWHYAQKTVGMGPGGTTGNPAKRMLSRYFRYRLKLNKCCGYKDIRSEWDLIRYPAKWLQWSSGGQNGVEPELPEKTPQVWGWSGTPPQCHDSDSAPKEDDPYDYRPMWSPWSQVVKMPDGEDEGIMRNRNYKQKCYEGPPEDMPEVFGTYARPESDSYDKSV